jgi:hypothetical protein
LFCRARLPWVKVGVVGEMLLQRDVAPATGKGSERHKRLGGRLSGSLSTHGRGRPQGEGPVSSVPAGDAPSPHSLCYVSVPMQTPTVRPALHPAPSSRPHACSASLIWKSAAHLPIVSGNASFMRVQSWQRGRSHVRQGRTTGTCLLRRTRARSVLLQPASSL